MVVRVAGWGGDGMELTGIELADRLLRFAATFLVTYGIGRFVLVPVLARLLSLRSASRTITEAVLRVVRAVALIVAFAYAYDAGGFGDLFAETATFAAALTIAVGFATRDIASNLVSGVFIVSDRRFNIGDWIEWNDRNGVIEAIGFRVTRVRTFDDELITVPNSQLATNAVTNAVASDRLRISADFWIGYGDDVDEATDILLDAAERTEGIIDDPEPTVRVTDVNDSRIRIESRVWIAEPSRPDYVRIRSEYLKRVTRRFREAGISLPPSW